MYLHACLAVFVQEDVIACIIQQGLIGLDYLHSHSHIHRCVPALCLHADSFTYICMCAEMSKQATC